MNKKIIIAGILAAVVMYIWSSIAHVVLPIGEMGISSTANEQAVLSAMKANISEPGLYFLPGHEIMTPEFKAMPKAQQDAAMKAFQEKAATMPSAIMVYRPVAGEFNWVKYLGLEFLSDLVAGWIFAYALWVALPRVTTFAGRIAFVTLLGTLPFIVSDFSYWNWYGYPTRFEVGQILDYVVGALLAGIVLAWFFRREPVQAS
jgi:hypothetical protein